MLMFRCSCPSVYHQTGNYRGYYAKRRPGNNPHSRDERLALISKEWLQDKRVLDIGCNAGKVTIEIGAKALVFQYSVTRVVLTAASTAQRFGPYRVTGVDIDTELIKQAHKGCKRRFNIDFSILRMY
jgi:7SK snRNA methylphosphate capping enzyme